MTKYIWIAGIFIVVILGLAFKQAPKEPPVAGVPDSGANSAQAPVNTAEPIVSASGNIKVSKPDKDSVATSPLLVKGQARVFEGTFQMVLKDSSGKEIVKKTATVAAADAGQFGDFGELLLFDAPKTDKGTLEVFDLSAKDGSVQDLVSIPVKFK